VTDDASLSASPFCHSARDLMMAYLCGMGDRRSSVELGERGMDLEETD